MTYTHPLMGTLLLTSALLPACGSDDKDGKKEPQTDAGTASEPFQVTVNEIMPSNQSTLPDPDNDGKYGDWIELYNAGNSPAHLENYFISDSQKNPTKHRFGAQVVVPPKGFVILWADKHPERGQLHLFFGLSKDGEGVWLSDPQVNALVGTGTTYPAVPPDTSYARFPDGTGPFSLCATATPGLLNGPACSSPITPGTSTNAAGGRTGTAGASNAGNSGGSSANGGGQGSNVNAGGAGS